MVATCFSEFGCPIFRVLKSMCHMIKKTLFMLCVAAMASACTKYGIIDGDDDGDGTAVTDISAAGGQATAGLYAKTVFKGPKADGYRWILDGKEVSTASTYELTPSRQGVYDLRLETSAATYVRRPKLL